MMRSKVVTKTKQAAKSKADMINPTIATQSKRKHRRATTPTADANLLERVSNGFVAFDAQMNYTYLNTRGGELLGRKSEDLIGKNYWTEYPEARDTPFAQACVRALETQQTIVLEDFYAPSDRWFENRIHPSQDGLVVSFIDITGRKRAEEQIRFKAALLAEVSDAVIASDENFVLTAWNSAAEKIYGWTAQEALGKPGESLIPSEFVGKSRAEASAELRATGELSAELIQPRKDGTRVYIDARTTVLRDASGRTIGYLSVNRDITERKRAEEALRAFEELFSKAFFASPAGMTITRIADGKFIAANDSFLQLFEFSRAEVIGHTSTELNMWTLEEGEKLIQQQLASEGVRNFELQARLRSGRVVNILFSSKPIELGGETHHITTMIEITERKQAEEGLRLSRNSLAELSRQLVQSHESEARAIGRELHDQIGQMLTALKLILEIAPRLPPELRVQKQAQAQELVDELMNRVSRLSLELRPPMLDDLGLIPALLWHVNRYREQMNIAVDFKHSGAEGIRFDSEIETTAYRIVQESLTNVARHAHATRARLEVHVRGGRMDIKIEDDGAGFDPQAGFDQQRGLNGMRERVHLLGGSFQIESQPGKGTKKFIQLPLREKTP